MSEVVLDAERDFEALRDPVWHRFRARHVALGRERFEDAYSEWWVKELERAAAGRPSRASSPVPFVTEAVHRVLVDEGRARARGLSRTEKAGLQFTELSELVDAGGGDDTESQARYEAVAHRVLRLVRDRLTARELQVFICTHLYLQTTEAAAGTLGLSVPRVKKDRGKIAARVGDDVRALLLAELDLSGACAGPGDLGAVFEVLADHVEDCEGCARSFGGLRRGALAVVGPFELLALAPAERSGGIAEALYGRAVDLLDRLGLTATGMPAGGRGMATAAAAAVAVAGGGAAVSATGADRPDGPAVVVETSVGPAADRTGSGPSAPGGGVARTEPRSSVIRTGSDPAERRPTSANRRKKPQPRTSVPESGDVAATPPPVTPEPLVVPEPAPTQGSASTGEFEFERR